VVENYVSFELFCINLPTFQVVLVLFQLFNFNFVRVVCQFRRSELSCINWEFFFNLILGAIVKIRNFTQTRSFSFAILPDQSTHIFDKWMLSDLIPVVAGAWNFLEHSIN
jgi:hypothetical protein